ncbi:IS630 family transposase [Halosquirtibacter xylanolyticus]|uniref:IS630 family transposase n=1 Tax=Halosquirtibacter xylanolyticus TaxID=3374599 RepID=UPI0037484C83|nr:IS630 family transposase [Prolixibacteraceae bacterium]
MLDQFGIVIAITTTGDYLRRWGFTPQKLKKRAYEQNSVAVQKWLDEDYPSIARKAKAENAEIYWGDETGVKNNCNHGRSYSLKGRTAVKKSMSKKTSINLISTVTNQGKVQFMIYSGSMNSDRLIEFMTQLIKTSKKKIFLILDNLKIHQSKVVKEWLSDNKNKIELFFLPSDTPDRNPDEFLNCDLKQGLSIKPSPRTQEKLTQNVKDQMTMLKESPYRVKKYFKADSIKYAA